MAQWVREVTGATAVELARNLPSRVPLRKAVHGELSLQRATEPPRWGRVVAALAVDTPGCGALQDVGNGGGGSAAGACHANPLPPVISLDGIKRYHLKLINPTAET